MTTDFMITLANDLRDAAVVIEDMAGSEFTGTASADVYLHTTTAEFQTLIRVLGGTRRKHESGSYFWVSRRFGAVRVVIVEWPCPPILGVDESEER